MKKIIFIIAIVAAAAILITVLSASISVFGENDAEDILYGDCNGDGKVDAKDLVRLRKYLDNLDEDTHTSTTQITEGADCNGDDQITGKDLVRLRKYLDNYDEETGQSTVTLGKEKPAVPATTEQYTEPVTDPVTEPVTEEPPQPEYEYVFKEWDSSVRNTFSQNTQTAVDITDEGVKFTFNGTSAADPHVNFSIFGYTRAKGLKAPESEYGKFLLFKLKSVGGDGVLEIFTHMPAAGDSSATSYEADGQWQYVIVDMTKTTITKPAKLTTIRIDWSGIGTASGAYLVISEIGLFRTADEAMEYAGMTEASGDEKTVKTVSIPETGNAEKYITSTNANVAVVKDVDGVIAATITSTSSAPRVYLNVAECAAAQGAVMLKQRYAVICFKTNSADLGARIVSISDVSGKTVNVTKSSTAENTSGWQCVMTDLKGLETNTSILKKVAVEFSGLKTSCSVTLRSITMTDDINEALTLCGHPEYCLNYEELSENDDLSDVVLTAEHEDASLKLWFDQSTEKTGRAVTESTGRTGYTVRMAKNEAENCQFFIAPASDMTVTVTVDEFRNEKGDKVDFELFYEYYHNILGELLPDALPPLTGALTVPANTSQGFVIQLTTKPGTPAGTYSSLVHVYDSEGREIKRAAVAVKVWDFELSEKTALRTSFALWPDYVINSYNWDTCGFNQQEVIDNYYEFFLRYRVNIMDIPHGLTSGYASRFLNLDRVNTARWSNLDLSIPDDNDGIIPAWIDKVIYYTVDEPRENYHFESLIEHTNRIKSNTPDYRMVCPFERDLYLTADGKITTADNADFDSVGFLSQYINIWCPKLDSFTSRDLKFYSGVSFLQSIEQDAKYGTFTDRMKAEVTGGDELWTYICVNPTEPYANWQILSDGTEAIVSMWQMKEYGITGALYWAVDYWKVNYWDQSTPWSGGAFGDGMLVYSGYKFGLPTPVSSVRLESIRDGIEDYQMLCMLEEKLGSEALSDMLARVTTSVVTYTDNDDYLHAVRILLGDMLEAAYAE